jgi:hypothetical protein
MAIFADKLELVARIDNLRDELALAAFNIYVGHQYAHRSNQ